MTTVHVPFQRRPRKEKEEGNKANKVKEEDLQFRSPIDVKEKDALKISLGELRFEQMWRPSVCTLITNTGTQLKLELTSPGSLKFKPAGDVSYDLSDVKFFWAFDNFGSCHMIDGKKYALEVDFTFKYSYQITVTSDLLVKRMELHKLYEDLANEADEEKKTALEVEVEAKEDEYDQLELSILEKRYIHSEAKEALMKRKPTKFVLEKMRGMSAAIDDNDDDESYSSYEEGEDSEEAATASKVNLNREIQFKVERAVHELAARRFAPIYEELQKKKSIASEEEVNTFLAGVKASLRSVPTPWGNIDRDDPVIDHTMFPRERDKEKERMRRAKYQSEKTKRELKEQADKMDWVRVHEAEIQVKVALLFEVRDDAPYYSLFSFLPRVTEPFSRILVDGNLLMPFKDALESPDFFTYAGSRFLHQDQEVVWIIMKNPLPILNDQLWTLRNLKNEFGKPMESTTTANMEELNGRKIYFNVVEKKPEPPTCPGKDKCMCELEPGTSWKAYKGV